MNHKLKIRSKKYLAAARGQSCTRCGVNDGTVVAAHYTGFRSHQFGKGTGTKVHDLLVADLCMECHAFFDNPDLGLRHNTEHNRMWKKLEMSEEFMFCVAMTQIRRCEQGILYTDDIKLGDG